MSVQKPQPVASSPAARARSFLGYAFLISLVIHALTVPFFHLKGRQADKPEDQKVSISKKIKVVVPTPPPPTPTPPPPTPPPKSTPPPVKQTNPPPQPKLVVKPPKTTSESKSGPTETKADTTKPVNENGVPQGTVESAAPAPPAPVSSGPPATPAPPPTPKPPLCANPNVDATVRNAAELEYPEIARQSGAVGTATVKVTLTETGAIVGAEIQKSAGNAALDQAALKAARATTYAPEVVNCVKTAGSYLFRADFTGQ